MLPHRTRLPVVNSAAVFGAEAVMERPLLPNSRRLLRRRAGTATGFPERAMSWRVARQEDERREVVNSWRSGTPAERPGSEALAAAQEWYASGGARFDESLLFVVSNGGEPAVIFPCYRRGREIRLAGDEVAGTRDVIVSEDTSDSELRDSLRLLSAWVRRRCAGCELVFERLSPAGRLLPLLESMDPAREQWYRLRQSSEVDRAISLSEVAGNRNPDESGDGSEAPWVSIRLLPRTIEALPRFLGGLLHRWWHPNGRRDRVSGEMDTGMTRRSPGVDSVPSGQED